MGLFCFRISAGTLEMERKWPVSMAADPREARCLDGELAAQVRSGAIRRVTVQGSEDTREFQ